MNSLPPVAAEAEGVRTVPPLLLPLLPSTVFLLLLLFQKISSQQTEIKHSPIPISPFLAAGTPPLLILLPQQCPPPPLSWLCHRGATAAACQASTSAGNRHLLPSK
ncbi:hypothetical protein JOB18_017413 [Solea senegalensis]|uniref:Uncharacterized protein n=1 Tax=Solea senegalensis TaxID=28829 RepID=A0AAV6SJG8_SOLSE|nr:hypothetical protein JOB18_017413 [Solea senegalensis]